MRITFIPFFESQHAMADEVAFHQRISQQYNSLDEREQRRFDEMVGRLQRGGIFSIPASKRKAISGRDVRDVDNLWVIDLSPDLRLIVDESDQKLTVREIARKGRIGFYRDLTRER